MSWGVVCVCLCVKLDCLAVIVAESIPYLGLFISLVGAIGATSLALVLPPVLELIILWKAPGVAVKFIIIKDLAIFIFGLTCCVTGTYESIYLIIHAIRNDQSSEI